MAFTASTQAPEGSLGGDDTTVIRAFPGLTTALKALRDVYVLWLQRWRRGWSRSLPAVDAQVACRCSRGAAAGHDRPPTPTALDAHKDARDYQSMPTDHWGEVCALGWLPWWESVIAALSSHRSTFKSQSRIRGRIGPDKAFSYQTVAPGHISSLGVNLY